MHDEHVSYRRVRWCVAVYTSLAYDVLPKKICPARNISFWPDSQVFKWPVHCPFFGWYVHCQAIWLLSNIQQSHSTWKLNAPSMYVFVFLIYMMFYSSRVQTPDLTAGSFCRHRVWLLGLTACFRPIESLAYVACPHEWRNRCMAIKKTQSEAKNLSAWLVVLADWRSRREATCVT